MIYRFHCNQCRRPEQHCYCKKIIHRENIYPVKIIQSVSESKHPFNTGRIAELSLSNCEKLLLDKNTNINESISKFIPSNPVIAFPTTEASDISTITLAPSTPIIFIDDTWRKAKRILHENPELNKLPKICLPPDYVSTYSLRSATKHLTKRDQGLSQPMCTLEAIAHCLDVLEGKENYYRKMLQCLSWIISKQEPYSK